MVGKARSFSDSSKDTVYQKEFDDEVYAAAAQQNSYNLGSVHFSDQSGIANISQAGSDQRKANLEGALFRGNIGFNLQTAVLDVPTDTIDLLEDGSSVALSTVSTDRIVSLSSGTTADLVTILGSQRPGQRLTLYNIFGNTITIKHTAAATANTILTPDTNDFTFENNMVIELVYDITTTKWRLRTGVSGGTGGGGGGEFFGPWTANHDAGNFTLNNIAALSITDSVGGVHGLLQGLVATGIRLAVTAGETFQLFDNVTSMVNISTSGGIVSNNLDLTMGTGNIVGGGAGEGLTNAGHIDFIDNLATPGGISIYSDGTDLFVTAPLNMNAIDILEINNLRGDVDGANQYINSFGTTTGIAGDESWEVHMGQDGFFQVADSVGIKFRVGGQLNPLVESIDLTVSGDLNVITSGGLFMNNGDITMGTGEIIAGGAAKEINNIGELVFVNNTLSPAGNGIFFFDGTDLKAKTGATTVNLTDIGGSNFTDAVFRVTDEIDLTKKFAVDVGGNTTGTTATLLFAVTADRTISFPNATTTLAGLSTTHTWTGTNTFDVNIVAGGAGDGMSNIGNLLFVDNLATPVGISIYSDGADLLVTSDINFNGFDAKLGNGQVSGVEVVGFFDVGGQINVSAGAAGFNFVTTADVPFRFTPNSTNILDITDAGIEMIAGAIDLNNLNVIGVNQIAFNEANQTITDSATGLDFSLPDATDQYDFVIDTNLNMTIDKFFINMHNSRIQMNDEIDPASPVAGDVYFYAKLDGGFAKLFYKQSDGTVVGPLAAGGGGSQTPWLSDIDGDGFNLQDVGAIEFRGEADPGDTFAFINEDLSNVLRFHAVVGGTIRFRLGSTDEILVNNTSFRPVSDEGMELGTAGARFLDVNTVGVTLKNTGTKVPAANIHEIVGQTSGMFFGVDDLTDEFRFYFAGQEHLTILQDGEIQFPQDGHEIVPQGTAFQMVTGNANDRFEVFNGTSASNASMVVEDFRTTWRTPTSDTQAYILQLIQNNNTPADFRTIVNIDMFAENSSSVDTIYARVSSSSQDITSGTEDGLLQLGVVSGGTLVSGIDIEGSSSGGANDALIGFFGETPVVQQNVASDTLANLYTALRNLGLIV
jgi:hypothetical protein